MHVARAVGHKDEVRHRRGVDRAARAGAHDRGDLGDHAGSEGVPQEYVGVAGQALDALLDPRAPRVVEPYDGGAGLHRHIHDLAYLIRKSHPQGAPEDREILRKEEDLPAFDLAVAGDDAVAVNLFLRHAEVGAGMGHEAVQLHEGPLVEKKFDPFAGGKLPFLVLLIDPLLSASEQRLRPSLLEFRPYAFHRSHRYPLQSRVPSVDVISMHTKTIANKPLKGNMHDNPGADRTDCLSQNSRFRPAGEQ